MIQCAVCPPLQKDFFQLKELEKLCHKEKGITSMSVKEILTSLVDDGMVDTDKIGTCVYFWAFPSKASQNVGAVRPSVFVLKIACLQKDGFETFPTLYAHCRGRGRLKS